MEKVVSKLRNIYRKISLEYQEKIRRSVVLSQSKEIVKSNNFGSVTGTAMFSDWLTNPTGLI